VSSEQDAEERKRKKWLYGCLGGCLGLVLVVGGCIAVGLYLTFRPVRVLPAETFLSAETRAFAVVRIRGDDPGLVALIEAFASNPPEMSQLDERWRKRLRGQARQMGKDVRRWTPIHIVAVGTRGDHEGELKGGLAVSLGGVSAVIARVVRLQARATGAGRATTREYKDVVLYGSDEKGLFAAVKNNLMIAGDAALMRDWIDRIQAHEATRAEGPTEQEPVPRFEGDPLLVGICEKMDSSLPLAFATLNTQGEVEFLLSRINEAKDKDDTTDYVELGRSLGLTDGRLKALGGGMKVLSSDKGAFFLIGRCQDEDFARELAARLRLAMTKLQDKGAIENLSVSAEANAVRVDAQIPDLQKRIRSAVERADKDASPLPESGG